MKTASRLALAVALACFLAPAAFAEIGAVASTDQAEVCAEDGRGGSAYSRAHRTSHGPGRAGFEHDHIVPLCLGGADTEANLVWQPLDDAREKDKLEAYACQQVCRYHRVPLAEAQGWFTGGWIAAYGREIDATVADRINKRWVAAAAADMQKAIDKAYAGHETAEVLAERKLPGYAAYLKCVERVVQATVEHQAIDDRAAAACEEELHK